MITSRPQMCSGRLARDQRSVINKIGNVVRGIKQRWGSRTTKQTLWDREYSEGRWGHCEHTPDAFIYQYVYRHCRNRSVLDLGCGSGNTGNELAVDKYRDYTGVDISEVAVEKAAARSGAIGRSSKNQYVQGDVLTYVPTKHYEVILFRESIYYVPPERIKSTLQRYSKYLADEGVFIVHVSGTKPRNARRILAIIEREFRLLEKDSPNNSWDFVAVFASSDVASSPTLSEGKGLSSDQERALC